MKGETIIWKGKSSQLVNFGTYFIGTLVALFCLDLTDLFSLSNLAVVVAIVRMVWKYYEVKCDEYIITNHRIRRRTGIINRRTFDIEMNRIHDIELREPLFYRIFGLGNIRVMNLQYDKNEFYLRAIPYAHQVREELRGGSEGSRTFYLPSYSGLLDAPN